MFETSVINLIQCSMNEKVIYLNIIYLCPFREAVEEKEASGFL